MKTPLCIIETIVAMSVLFVSSVVFLGEHSTDMGRLVNFAACLIAGLFLFGISLITGRGQSTSSCRDESTSLDWFKQECYRHADLYIAVSMITISIISALWPSAPPVAIQAYQLANSVMLTLAIMFFAIVQSKIRVAAEPVSDSFIYRPSEAATYWMNKPWTG